MLDTLPAAALDLSLICSYASVLFELVTLRPATVSNADYCHA